MVHFTPDTIYNKTLGVDVLREFITLPFGNFNT